MSRIINISFDDNDVSLLDRWKGAHALDYARTVRLSLAMMRRLERHVGEGYTRMVLFNRAGEKREFDDITEFVPADAARKV